MRMVAARIARCFASKRWAWWSGSRSRHFYKPQPLRSLDEIAADIVAAEK